MSKTHARQTKRQIRIDNNWDGEEANFADLDSSFVKEFLFPHYKFLKEGWMEYDNRPENLSTFVQGVVGRLVVYRTKVLLYRTMVLLARLTKVRR